MDGGEGIDFGGSSSVVGEMPGGTNVVGDDFDFGGSEGVLPDVAGGTMVGG